MIKLKAIFARLTGCITPESRRIAIDAFVVGFLALIIYTVIWGLLHPSAPFPCFAGESGLACNVRSLRGQ